jgi:hypothetical protein
MSQELTIPLSDMSAKDMAAFLGQAEVATTGFPRFAINRDAEDDDENTLPVGTYVVWSPEHEINVYSKTATIRPMMQRFHYAIYDSDENKWSNQSIKIRDLFSDEAIDEKGGVKCGKVSKRDLKNLSQADQDYQKKIRCYRTIYGLASMEGVSAKGDDITLTEISCIWKTSGSNFMPLAEVFDQVIKQKKLMFNFAINLAKPRKEKNGANVYYVAVPTIDLSTEIPFTDGNMETLKTFNDIVSAENVEIESKWRNANKQHIIVGDNQAESFDNSGALDVDFKVMPPEEDLNDEIGL